MKRVMKEVVETKMVVHFEASDGTPFDSEIECKNYEYELVQNEKERNASRMRFNVNEYEWVSITGSYYSRPEYMWFKIENRDDLAEICECYRSWCGDLKNIQNIEEKIERYPDYVCIVDYPRGEIEADWFLLSRMLKQTKAFISQFPFNEDGNLI